METAIRISRDADNVATLWMDLPGKPVNTFSPQLFSELAAAIYDFERNKPAGVIFASAKRHNFSAGADLFEIREMKPDQLAEYLSLGQAMFERIARLPYPTVAAINGDCLGGGCELALACKWRVAADDTSISIGLPEIKLGILPAWGGTTRLPRLIGLRAALPILLAGKTMPPRKAVKAGFVDEVVRPEALMAAANRLVRGPARQSYISMLDRRIAQIPIARNKILSVARDKTLRQTHGNYPAPIALLDVVRTGYEHGFNAGLEAERRSIRDLIAQSTSRNLLRLFYLRQAAKKEAMASLHAKPLDVKYTAVIGGGTMGAGIAHALAKAGMLVRLIEVDPPAVSTGLGRIKKMLDDDVYAGRLDRLAARNVFNRISPSTTWTGLELADLVVEAVLEKIETKREVFSKLDRLTRPTAVLGSNTSSLRIADIAQATLHPDRVVGLHFFNPVPKMPLVEIVRGPHSDDASLATAVAIAGRIGKTPVLVNDAPGFLVNRILTPYLAQALVMAGEGTPIASIDHAMKAWGMPMGPFELLDEIGLDIASHVLKSLEQNSIPPANVVATLAQAMQQKWLGKKSGRGFYEYTGKKPTPNVELLATLSTTQTQIPDETIQHRLIQPMVNEAVKLLQEHVTDSHDTIDLATVFGLGFAPFRGGIMQYARDAGLLPIAKPSSFSGRPEGARASVVEPAVAND